MGRSCARHITTKTRHHEERQRLHLIPRIHRATHRLGLYLSAVGDLRLTQGEAHILALLAEGEPATISALHEGLGHKRSTLTSILDRLVDRGLIVREVGRTDRRTFEVALTPLGREVALELHRDLTDLERAVATNVSKQDVRGFLRVLAAVEDLAKAAPGP